MGGLSVCMCSLWYFLPVLILCAESIKDCTDVSFACSWSTILSRSKEENSIRKCQHKTVFWWSWNTWFAWKELVVETDNSFEITSIAIGIQANNCDFWECLKKKKNLMAVICRKEVYFIWLDEPLEMWKHTGSIKCCSFALVLFFPRTQHVWRSINRSWVHWQRLSLYAKLSFCGKQMNIHKCD